MPPGSTISPIWSRSTLLKPGWEMTVSVQTWLYIEPWREPVWFRPGRTGRIPVWLAERLPSTETEDSSSAAFPHPRRWHLGHSDYGTSWKKQNVPSPGCEFKCILCFGESHILRWVPDFTEESLNLGLNSLLMIMIRTCAAPEPQPCCTVMYSYERHHETDSNFIIRFVSENQFCELNPIPNSEHQY